MSKAGQRMIAGAKEALAIARGEKAPAAVHHRRTPRPKAKDRIDYDDSGNLDDVVVTDVDVFRLEYMSDKNIWLRCYRTGKPDVVFWLSAKSKIIGARGEE